MKKSIAVTISALAMAWTVAGNAAVAEAKTLGIVALLANDALNIAVIAGATDAAKEAGWDVKVTDTQANADQANLDGAADGGGEFRLYPVLVDRKRDQERQKHQKKRHHACGYQGKADRAAHAGADIVGGRH